MWEQKISGVRRRKRNAFRGVRPLSWEFHEKPQCSPWAFRLSGKKRRGLSKKK